MNFIQRYTHWLHTRWPAGTVEKLPFSREDGSTNIDGVYVVGDLRGIPLLKFAADSGARAVQHIVADGSFSTRNREAGIIDLAIVGGGVGGMAAALEARRSGLTFAVLESSEPFSTIVNFPKGKPIFTYPTDMEPAGALQMSADVKEDLVDELRQETRDIDVLPLHAERILRRDGHFVIAVSHGDSVEARRVIVSLGRSGDFRTLGVPGEHLDKVYNRLHDPTDFRDKTTLVVGGGDSALETAVALGRAGSKVTLSYRGSVFSRPKAENTDALDALHDEGRITTIKPSTVREIRDREVVLDTDAGQRTIKNDVVFTMIGREAPLGFFRRSGLRIPGDRHLKTWLGLTGFVLFCVALYNWKSGGRLSDLFYRHHWWPVSIQSAFAKADPASFIGTLAISASSPSFWYTLAYCALVVGFGIARIRRRKTPYITAQTITLMLIQVIPLFLLPEIILPLLDKHGLLWKPMADALFPAVDYGHGREFWRAYGFVLAWPLNVYNVFTDQPLGWWLVISIVQTLIVIPVIIYFWGKGAYCGWICSCGALAETLGDTHRQKMVHGPRWNRFNMVGQVVLLIAIAILFLRIYGWISPAPGIEHAFQWAKEHYKWGVDVLLAGVIGYGFYFWFSGRVWCRFMCPLAALMHIYARFSRFRILADKKKCISCNVCTSVCHQGIDIMNFANKGLPMEDPECVRCSACVQSCPTGVLTFGQVDKKGRTIATDRLAASPVLMRENRFPYRRRRRC